MLRLVPVDRDNWQECVNLQTSQNHARFVASNAYSIAEARFFPMAITSCIYDDTRMVGFAMYGPSEESPDEFWIDRLMIAAPELGRGYGRAALALILAEARTRGFAHVGLSTDPANAIAIRLFESAGFVATDQRSGEQVVYRYGRPRRSDV